MFSPKGDQELTHNLAQEISGPEDSKAHGCEPLDPWLAVHIYITNIAFGPLLSGYQP